MESLLRKVEQLEIAADIIDDKNDLDDRCHALERRLINDFKKLEEVAQMFEEYQRCLDVQTNIEKQYAELKQKLLCINRCYPKGIVTVCSDNEIEDEIMVQEQQKKQTAATPRKVLSDRSNIKIPSVCPSPAVTIPTINVSSVTSSVQKDKPKHTISIDYVRENEFAQISSYMKGRLTLDNINEFVDVYSSTLSKKYEQLNNYRKPKSKIEQKNQCLVWKEQEIGELVGTHFCTSEDMKELSGVACGSKKSQSIITILRHLKRIKEVRILKHIYYVACF